MILRRITEHVKAQNWTAVALDFVIVVVGVFMGIQLGNWNDARADKAQEAAILAQLKTEFTEIRDALEKQVHIRKGYVADLGKLIGGLEGTSPMPEDLTIKQALIAVRSTGRRPAQSAAYLQLTANGELARLSNEDLKQALIRYHARLERDAFIFPELMKMVVAERSNNKFVDFDVNAPGPRGAAIDEDTVSDEIRTSRIRAYDLAGLIDYEEQYETIYTTHANLVDTDKVQLELANEILKQISESHD